MLDGQLDAFDLLGVLPEPKPRGKSGRASAPKPEPVRMVTKWNRRYTCGHSANIDPHKATHHACPHADGGVTIDTIRVRVPA